MIDPRDEMIDGNLERLRVEVACLAENLEALTYHPDEFVKNGVKKIDKTTELYLSFWHEPEPVDELE